MELALNKEISHSKTVSRIIGIAFFAILSCLGAFVRIPLPGSPVPITLQTFFVLLSGACLCGNLGGASQSIYVLSGMAGLPVFTGAGVGLLYLLGPTGGYVFGFIIASLFVGNLIRRRGNRLFSVFLIFCLADFILLTCGTLWLKVVTGCSFAQAIATGFLPFMLGDLLKASAASAVYSRVRKRCLEVF
jgi:biotin transport system substrate-specific component